MKLALPLPLRLYRIGLALLEPAAPAFLGWRQRRGKEDAARLGERRGIAGRSRPEGDLVWLHGASVGETLALLPLIERLTKRGLRVLVTSGTKTSADLMAKRLPAGAIHQYVPLDVPRFASRFLDHWRPSAAFFAESEIWPNLILALERRQIPLVLVNGRVSPRSFRRWRKRAALAQALFSRFALCLAQSQADAERLSALGAPDVAMPGNLKFDVPPLPADPRLVEHLSGLMAGRPIWIAASTHPGEEEMVVAAHKMVAKRLPKLLTLIAPRHPVRGPEITALADAEGLAARLRSDGEEPDGTTAIYVADTIGELGIFYRLCPLVFMGGSLVPHGGQNPIEAAKLSSALLHGPHVHNFAETYAAIDHAGGCLPVGDAETLAHAVGDLLRQAGRMRDMGRAAFMSVEASSGALERTLQAIAPFLPQGGAIQPR